MATEHLECSQSEWGMLGVDNLSQVQKMQNITVIIFFKILFIYLLETQEEAETQAEGEAGSMRGARCGTRSGDPRITP